MEGTAVGAEELTRRVRERALELGFDDVGVTTLRDSDHAAFYRAWLAAGRHGEMGYLARSDAVARRLQPTRAWPALRSAIVVAQGYWPVADGALESGPVVAADPDADAHRVLPGGAAVRSEADPSAGVIARYARGRDYHRVMRPKLLALLRSLEADIGRKLPLARAYVDTGPVLERELARRAGLGWFGRNTMLIDPRRGSYFFLGVLLVELELEPDTPFDADRCGTCRACLDACPTGALLGRDADGAPVMDATRCISYLTIENRGPIPEELRASIGNRIYGCDICQEVCPWNGKANQAGQAGQGAGASAGERDYRADARGVQHRAELEEGLPGTGSPSLVELMRMERQEWERWTRGSAMRRAGYAGFKRNVAVAMGNWLASQDEALGEAVAVLREAMGDESELVREHAAWALAPVRRPSSR
jgi:epoxyqueuosine reductase